MTPLFLAFSFPMKNPFQNEWTSKGPFSASKCQSEVTGVNKRKTELQKKKKKMISRCKEKTQQSFPEYHYYNLVNITISHSGLKPLHTSYKF
jgi:hypothetical protein